MSKLAAYAILVLSLTSCHLVSSYNAADLFLKYIPAGHCPNLTLVNHGPDDISFLTGDKSSVRVRIGDSGPLSRIVGSESRSDGSYPMGGGVVQNGGAYVYDLGLKCSPASVELRRTYDVFSIVTLTEDSTTASGLTVDAPPPTSGSR